MPNTEFGRIEFSTFELDNIPLRDTLDRDQPKFPAPRPMDVAAPLEIVATGRRPANVSVKGPKIGPTPSYKLPDPTMTSNAKICRFRDAGSTHIAVIDSDDPNRCRRIDGVDDDHFFDVDWDRVETDRAGANRSEPVPDRLLPPTPPGEKIICIGLNYRDHAIETGAEIPTSPVVFSKFNCSRIGSGGDIILPAISDSVDYEAELVVVIGRGGRNIAPEHAMRHVFGYTCGHDVSARDWQKGRPGGQWLLGKTMDTFAPLGPVVVRRDAIANIHDVGVVMKVGGEVMQQSRTSQLIFAIPELIAHLSKLFSLAPGDLIFTGTPPGVGAARTPPRFLVDGDVCDVEIEGIGRLRNQCRREPIKSASKP